MISLIKAFIYRLLGERAYAYLFLRKKLRDIRSNKFYERELPFLSNFIKPGDHVIDIGANYGHYTVKMAELCRPGKVYAFEPIPFTNYILTNVVRSCKLENVIIQNNAVTDRPGIISFTVPKLSYGAANTGLSHITRSKEAAENADTVNVNAITLDSFSEGLMERITFIKMDIEGAEYFALKGATALLQKHKPVVLIEISQNFLKQYGITEIDFLKLIDQLNYRMFILKSNEKYIEPLNELRNSNAFLIPHSRINEFHHLIR